MFVVDVVVVVVVVDERFVYLEVWMRDQVRRIPTDGFRLCHRGWRWNVPLLLLLLMKLMMLLLELAAGNVMARLRWNLYVVSEHKEKVFKLKWFKAFFILHLYSR